METREETPRETTEDGGNGRKLGEPYVAVGGEDESSTEHEGDDSHLREDQKSKRLST